MRKNKVELSFSFLAINGITFYRLVAVIFLTYLIINKDFIGFRWFLALSFFTDMIDGFLARKFKVVSVFGSKLDSVADDMTIVMAMAGLFVFKYDFLKEQFVVFLSLFCLYLVHITLALLRYRKITSFHTLSAKLAFLLQGVFLLLVFFLEEPPMPLFYIAVVVTAYQLIEEIIMISLLPIWKVDVKGIWWVLNKKS